MNLQDAIINRILPLSRFGEWYECRHFHSPLGEVIASDGVHYAIQTPSGEWICRHKVHVHPLRENRPKKSFPTPKKQPLIDKKLAELEALLNL